MQRERARLGASEPDSPLPLGPTFLIGALAGGVAAVLTNPLEVVVTRLMVQGHSLPESVPNIPASARTAEVDHVSSMPTSTGSQRASPVSAHAGVGGHHSVGVSRPDHHSPFTRYNGIIHGLRTIFRQEGMAGLLRGVVPRMVSNAPMAALTFAVYENIKQWFSTNREENMRRSNDEEGYVACNVARTYCFRFIFRAPHINTLCRLVIMVCKLFFNVDGRSMTIRKMHFGKKLRICHSRITTFCTVTTTMLSG